MAKKASERCYLVEFVIKLVERDFQHRLGQLICTFISENQGLEKLRSVSNLTKISGPAHVIFFSVDLNFFQFVNWIFSDYKPEKNSGEN